MKTIIWFFYEPNEHVEKKILYNSYPSKFLCHSFNPTERVENEERTSGAHLFKIIWYSTMERHNLVPCQTLHK
jgi:hypothetical protein